MRCLPSSASAQDSADHQAHMLRASLRRTAAATAPLRTLRRNLNLHEYQAAALMAEKGVNVPFGLPATTVEEAVAAAATIGDEQVVIKSQILAGGRGLGSFTNGLKGGVHVIKTSEVAEYAGKMLGGTLVTKQSGPEGKPVNTILLAKKMNLVREMYLAIMLDRASMGPVIIACSEGGTSIEDLAASHPDKIIKTPIDINVGITDAQATAVAKGLAVTGDVAAAAEQIKSLYRLFAESDCTMVEVGLTSLTYYGVALPLPQPQP
jgi:succinyl-CoA synthetase beta subunit